MSALTQGPVDPYPLPSKSELANGASRTMNLSKRQEEADLHLQSGYGDHIDYPPVAPEVPRGPPASYSQSYGPEEVNQQPARSFSQRAKGHMLAQESLEDHEYLDDHDDIPPQEIMIPEGVRKSTGRNDGRAPLKNGLNFKDQERGIWSGWPSTRPDVPSQNSRTRDHPRPSQRSADIAPLKIDVSSTSSRTYTVRGPKNLGGTQPRDWASDRSPLQTLEVKLNDISKEEKRARVEEAEMLLRESKAGRARRRRSKEIPAAPKRGNAEKESPLEPRSIEMSSSYRSPTEAQRDSMQPITDMELQKPDRRLPPGGNRQVIEHEEQTSAGIPVADEIPLHPDQFRPQQRFSGEGGQPHPAHELHDSVSSGKPRRGSFRDPTNADQPHPAHNPHLAYARGSAPDDARLDSEQNRKRPQNGVRRVISNQQAPVTQSIPSNITRAVTLQQLQPFFPDDKGTSRSRPAGASSSWQGAASLEATAGVGVSDATAATSFNRDSSRKLQKHPPGYATYSSISRQERPMTTEAGVTQVSASVEAPRFGTSTIAGDPKLNYHYQGLPEEAETQRSDSQRVPEPVGLGLRERTVTERNGMIDKPRQTSVSFKVPFDKARPVNEWKQAGTARLTIADLALELPSGPDRAWWERNGSLSRRRSKRSPGDAETTNVSAPQADKKHAEFTPPLYLKCGPLLRYTGIRKDRGEPQLGQANNSVGRETWRGSVMIVTQDSQSSYEELPTLRLFSQPRDLLPPPPEEVQGDDLAPEYVDPIAGLSKVSRRGQTLYVKPVDHLEEGKDLSRIENDDGLFEASPSPPENSSHGSATPNKRTHGRSGESLGKYKEVKAARLYADPERDVTFWRFNIEVELSEQQTHIAYRINHGPAVGFWVPARGQTMNIMFHSCNGFSLSANADQFGGPDPLWRDVLNTHQSRPFHVMIGGGDQIYNDRVMTDTNLFAAWSQLRNVHEKYRAPFTDEMREELESFYLDRYAMWFSQGLFGLANSQIPMVNIYDDHDIIDGFGSYPHDFQRSPVFMGIGNIAFKYYLLFQHQSVPEETQADEPSWLLGAKPGPYIQQLSRSIFLNLGRSVAFLGLDCRTERERYFVLTDDTYEVVLDRCRREIDEGETKHLLVLIGVPLAYPRLVWLENILTSRAMTPVKALGRAGIFRGGFLNKFDGGVEVLDDLDDHWTASGHKEERNNLIYDLQELAAEKSIRITVLGGDVHLGAVGQFYSTPKLKIPKDKDHRYMPNVISSAIVNTPPPEMLADTLNKRNKVHQLDSYTVEDMIPMFTHDVDGRKRNNKRLLPRRNWCSIREYQPGSTPPPSPLESPTPSDQISESEDYRPQTRRRFSFSREDANPRKLLRRLSQRGGPPSSYRDDMAISSPIQARRASHDGYFPTPEQHRTVPPTRTSFPINNNNPAPPQTAPPGRSSFNATASYNQRASIDALPSAPQPRPGIFRRPTNLSEKAAKKGGAPIETDSQGNLIGDLSDHVNLEGGLDITLNFEVSQGDPAGITTPYRLLVPALRYDGTSDSQKLDPPHGISGSGVQRGPTLLNKLGFGRTGNRSIADRQGEGNWGQASESESEVFSEGRHSEDGDEVYDGRKRSSRGGAGGLKRLFSARKATKQERYAAGYAPEYDQRQQQQPRPPMSGPIRIQTQDEIGARELRISTPQQPNPLPQPHPQVSQTPAKRSYGEPPNEPFPSQARGKAARVMGVDQGPLPAYSQAPLPLPQRPQQQQQQQQQQGAALNARANVSVNRSQPLPPPSRTTMPSAQDAEAGGGARERIESRYYVNHDLGGPPPNQTLRGGTSPASVAASAGAGGRGTGVAGQVPVGQVPVGHGYNGVEAYRENRPRRLRKWF